MIEKLSEKEKASIIEEPLVDASNIYIDLEYLRYISLGKLMSCQNITADIYRKIIDELESPCFLDRVTDCPMILFSHIRELQRFVDGCKVSNRNDDQTVLQSPPFDSETDIYRFITLVKDTKRIKDSNLDISITINTGVLKGLTGNVLRHLRVRYEAVLGVPVSFISKGFSDFKPEEILAFDTFFIHSLHDFNDAFIDMLNERKFYDATVFARKILPSEFLIKQNQKDIELEELFITVHAVMFTASNFTFTRAPRCIISST